MKLVVLACCALVIPTSCRHEEDSPGALAETGVVETEPPAGVVYDEVWMMRGWQGYMGMVLGLREGEFHYWFYSDVNPTVQWAKGTYRRNDAGIRLRVSQYPSLEGPQLPNEGAVLGREFVQTDQLYNETWRIVHEDNATFLASADDLAKERDSGRWLRPVDPKVFAKYFVSSGPFILHMNPQLEGEQASSGQPATRPESKFQSSDKPQPEAEGRSR